MIRQRGRPTRRPAPARRAAAPAAALAAPAAMLAAALLGACVHVPTPEERRNAEIHHDLGVAAVRKGDAQEALKEFREAVRLRPEFPEALNALGLLHHWSFANLAEAERWLRKAVDARPGYSEAWNNLGVLLAERGDLDGARAAFEKALSDPLYATPWMAQTNLGWLAHQRGDTERGVALVRAALTARADYCMGHRQLARMEAARGRAEAADASWDAFERHCPDEPEALLRTGLRHLGRNEVEEARRALERCLVRAGVRPPADECGRTLRQLPPAKPAPAAPPAAPEEPKGLPGSRDLGDAP